MGDWITGTIIAMGYLGVLLLTLLEAVFWPLPSELILPLAGYLASHREMTLAGVIVAGTAGSVLGRCCCTGSEAGSARKSSRPLPTITAAG